MKVHALKTRDTTSAHAFDSNRPVTARRADLLKLPLLFFGFFLVLIKKRDAANSGEETRGVFTVYLRKLWSPRAATFLPTVIRILLQPPGKRLQLSCTSKNRCP